MRRGGERFESRDVQARHLAEALVRERDAPLGDAGLDREERGALAAQRRAGALHAGGPRPQEAARRRHGPRAGGVHRRVRGRGRRAMSDFAFSPGELQSFVVFVFLIGLIAIFVFRFVFVARRSRHTVFYNGFWLRTFGEVTAASVLHWILIFGS